MRLSIHYKITILFSLVIALVLFFIYFNLNKGLQSRANERIRSDISRELTLLKYYLENPPAEGWKGKGIDDLADNFSEKVELRVTIIDINGVVLGDSELDGQALINVENHLYRPEVTDAINSGKGESTRFSTTIKKNMLYMATLYGKGKRKGIVRLAVPLSELEQISSQLKKTVGASLLIAFPLALVITFLASSFISKPLREISAVTDDIAKGILDHRVRINSHDEIGELAKAFNYMSDQIAFRIKELNISRSRLEAVFLNMIEGVMVVDSEGKIILINKTLKDFLNIIDNPIGRKPIEVIRNVEVQETIDHALEDSFHLKTFEVVLLAPKEKVMSVNAAPVIRDSKGDGAILVFHDITTFRQLERVRKDFVANVSHELRTPVSTIKGYAETLLDGAFEDKENARDFAQIILSDSNRLAALIDDLLDLSRIEADTFDIELKPISLKAVTEKIISGLKKQADEKEVTLNIDIPDNFPPILADEARLSQVLLNLVDNAVKYNRPNGRVTVSAKERGDTLQIDISDNGIGIPEADIPRLFERFYRVDKARSREVGSTGLGLSIVKHIIAAHKGKVWVSSQQGKGSTFSFTLQKA